MSFFDELKRRNVFRIGIAYVLMGWVLLQAADFAFDLIGAPNWMIQSVSVVVVIGLPIALFFAWAFEMTPEGIKRETDVDRSQSIAPRTGRKLDLTIIAMLLVVIVLMAVERVYFSDDSSPKNTDVVDNVAKSVAVLPFVNMSADADNEYFSDGVSEEILNALTGVPELKVAARTSAFAFKGSNESIAEIAAKLGVSHVLEGSVRKAGDQVRITAQLIKADDGFHLWSQTYDRELTNIFTIQDEIAGSIANMLQVQLLGEQKNFTTTKDLSPENYEKFLKARFLMRRRNADAMNEAETLTRQVLTEAPDFPRGQIQLAEILTQAGRQGRDEREEIRALASSAIALDPDLPAAYMIQGSIALDDKDILGGIHHLQKAIELDPSEPRPHHWLGIAYAETGYLEKARQQLQIAVDLEPDHANANGYLGFVLILQGDFERARFHTGEQVRLGNMFGSPRLVYIDILTGDLNKARRTAAETDGIGTETRKRMALLINAIEDPSITSQYLEFIKNPGLDNWQTGSNNWYISSDNWHITIELFLMGLYTESLRLNENGPPYLMSWADYWSEARALPEFAQILKTRNFFPVWNELGPPPMCRKTRQSYDCRKD